MPQHSSPADWSAVKTLFEQALALPAAERGAFVANAQADAAVCAEVLSLLAHHGASTGTGEAAFLASPAARLMSEGAARTGQRLGAWEIVRPLGAGGMGEVFEARRADGQYEGRAAIKLLKRGMDSAAVLQRFALERQALARLQHPHIAGLLDAGLSDDGQPFFVMAYVDGLPLDAAMAGRSLKERLALFLQLADAVAYAHRSLLVHRDLKPGNVLVTPEGQVMLLDFGIAKLLDPGEGLDADQTSAAARPFTPNYASPEQVRGEAVTTATDIYSLGVLLYLMLTGVRPYGRDSTSAQEAARSVLEDEPTRPSSLSPELVTDPAWLSRRRQLQGDLDNILLKALDKRIAQRYASVDALAADVRAHLDGRPVSARPASVGYLAAKFVQRHRGASAGAVAAVLALLLGLAGTSWQAHAARVAEQSAEARLAQIQELLRNIVSQHAQAISNLPGGSVVREAMLTEATKNLEQLAAQPGQPRETQAVLGSALSRLADAQGNVNGMNTGKNAEAKTHAEAALRAFEAAALTPADKVEHLIAQASAHKTLGRLARSAGQPADALAQFRRAEQGLRPALQLQPDNAELRLALAYVMGEIGQTYDTQNLPNLNQRDPALAAFAEARRLFESLARDTPAADVLMRHSMMLGTEAVVYDKHDELDASIGRLREAARVGAEAVRISDPPDTGRQWSLALVQHNLGEALSRQGDTAAAEAVMTEAWRLVDQLLRDNPGNASWQPRRTLFSLGLGRAQAANGHCQPAAALLQPLIARWAEAKDANAQRRRGLALMSLAQCAQAAGNKALARPQAAEAQATFARLASAETPSPRLLLIYEARALGVMAASATSRAEAAELKQRAETRFAQAAAISPLASDDRRSREAVARI
ncbi:serine/threonine-protein kinase [Roseateles toxinivorans]|uniref:Non-specific serine/threonine protein kinase/serine/threonine-protein kinase n=1 Tax=Roseateles toxinivorans TaxID=270368 RepID=A0A4R6QR74_9BURK|nr:serine/threonine-protein kinase [Roseateles toxinivorans]TDP72618.1 non-specific serine/threonine protein kinase/serine/threonine-protein kinase [Roseateles toxinivorans]